MALNINIIRDRRGAIRPVTKGKYILEIEGEGNSSRSDFNLSLYDTENNTVTGILPEELKGNVIPLTNCVWNSEDIYFASLKTQGEGKVGISVYRYEISGGRFIEILHAGSDSPADDGAASFKVFVLSEKYIVIQKERKRSGAGDSLMGNIEFEQKIYNTDAGNFEIVNDANLVNNGINVITPVSPTHILLKTGFSSLEDSRISAESESDALIESVYFISMSLFISSLMHESTFAGGAMLDTAYFDKSIIAPRFKDDFIYYTIADRTSRSAETVFYDIKNEKFLRCLRENPTPQSLDNAYVIGNTPYVKNIFPGRCEFFNVTDSETDGIFYDEEFLAAVGELLIFSEGRSGREYIRIYRSDRFNLILKERGRLIGCASSGDNYYIYVNR